MSNPQGSQAIKELFMKRIALFELDKKAHIKGTCSFSMTALCSAMQHEVYMHMLETWNEIWPYILELEAMKKETQTSTQQV